MWIANVYFHFENEFNWSVYTNKICISRTEKKNSERINILFERSNKMFKTNIDPLRYISFYLSIWTNKMVKLCSAIESFRAKHKWFDINFRSVCYSNRAMLVLVLVHFGMFVLACVRFIFNARIFGLIIVWFSAIMHIITRYDRKNRQHQYPRIKCIVQLGSHSRVAYLA